LRSTKNHPKLKSGQVIPIYSNQKTNDYLKEIAEKAGIVKPLSFHCARHIFATVITLSNGVPIETVSKMLGHTDIRTTQIYSRVTDEKIATDFKKLKATLHKGTQSTNPNNPIKQPRH
jgi:site-specific recombinase XerD